MFFRYLLVKILELKQFIKNTLSCCRVVAENVNEVCEVAEDFSENELKENLCLWSQCRITKLEHEKDNLVRGWGKLSTEELNSLDDKKKLKIIEDRLNLFHYKKPKKTKEIEVEQYHRYRK